MKIDDWFDLFTEARLHEEPWIVTPPAGPKPHFSPIRSVEVISEGRHMCPLSFWAHRNDPSVPWAESWLWAIRRVFGDDLKGADILAAEHIAQASDHTLAWLEKTDKYYPELNRIAPIRRRLGAFLNIPENLL